MDCERYVTNIFWADPIMILDYIAFGDVVVFDTTFGTNKEVRPLDVFTGFNHHREMIVFGAALLYDETVETFEWLFETFVEAHGGKKPKTIFTDQDAAMANAITNGILKETYHGLCTWHLMQNGVKHLGWRMKDGAKFLTEFKGCMFEYVDEEEFEIEWKKMIVDHKIENDDWVDRTYLVKKKWARCYMKQQLTLGIRSTQLSESLNSDLKAYLNCDLHATVFFSQFDRVVELKRYKELQAEYRARQRIPLLSLSYSPLLRQVSTRYTPNIFVRFQQEYDLASMLVIKSKDKTSGNYRVGLHDSDQSTFTVYCDRDNGLFKCNCMKFESSEILCCHILKMFSKFEVMEVPELYIYDRWTRGVKSRHVLNEIEPAMNESATEWCTRMQCQVIRMIYQASINEETRKSMQKLVGEYREQLVAFSRGDQDEVEEIVLEEFEAEPKNAKD